MTSWRHLPLPVSSYCEKNKTRSSPQNKFKNAASDDFVARHFASPNQLVGFLLTIHNNNDLWAQCPSGWLISHFKSPEPDTSLCCCEFPGSGQVIRDTCHLLPQPTAAPRFCLSREEGWLGRVDLEQSRVNFLLKMKPYVGNARWWPLL